MNKKLKMEDFKNGFIKEVLATKAGVRLGMAVSIVSAIPHYYIEKLRLEWERTYFDTLTQAIEAYNEL